MRKHLSHPRACHLCWAEARCVVAWLCDEVVGLANGAYRDDDWIPLLASCTWLVLCFGVEVCY